MRYFRPAPSLACFQTILSFGYRRRVSLTLFASCLRFEAIVMDFSQINLQYPIHAQDLARQDPRRAGVLPELPEDQVELLCSLTPDQLARFALIRSPLLIPGRALVVVLAPGSRR